MTKREAIHILIRHAAADCQGVGCGPGHQIPSEKERNLVALAVLKVWPEKHCRPNWFNLGLQEPVELNQSLETDSQKNAHPIFKVDMSSHQIDPANGDNIAAKCIEILTNGGTIREMLNYLNTRH